MTPVTDWRRQPVTHLVARSMRADGRTGGKLTVLTGAATLTVTGPEPEPEPVGPAELSDRRKKIVFGTIVLGALDRIVARVLQDEIAEPRPAQLAP